MARQAIRARRRHLAPLLEMPGRPDPQRLARPRRSPRRRPGSAPSAAPATARPAPRRTRARRDAAPDRRTSSDIARPLRHAARRAAAESPPSTSATLMSSRHQRGLRGTAARSDSRTHVEPRHRHVGRRPRPVALGIGRTEERDDRRADGGGDVQRAGVARHHQRRCRDERDEVGDRRSAARSCAAPLDARTTACASASSPGPHSTTDGRPRTSRRNAATSPNRAGGQRLFGHAAPGLISAKRAGARPRAGPRRAPATPTSASGNSTRPRLDADDAQQGEVLVDDVRRRRPRPAVVGLGVERPRALLAQVPDRKADHARARRTRAPAPPTSSAPANRSRRRSAAWRSAPDDIGPGPRSSARRAARPRSTPVTRSSDGAVLRVDQPVDPRVGKRARAAPPRPECACTMSPSAPERGRCRSVHRAITCRRSAPAGRASSDPSDRRRSRCGRRRRARCRARARCRRVVGALAVHVGLQQRRAAASTVGSGKTTT